MAVTIAGMAGASNEVSDIQWSRIWGRSGGREHVHDTGLAVTPTGTARQVSIAAGYVYAEGGVEAYFDAAETVTVAANSSGSTRYDMIVAEFNWSAQTVTIEAREGVSSVDSLTRTVGSQWDVPLALLEVSDGQGVFASGDIAARRPKRDTYCTVSLPADMTGVSEQSATLLDDWSADVESGLLTVAADGATVHVSGDYDISYDLLASHEASVDSWALVYVGTNVTGTTFATNLIETRIGWSPWTSSGAQGHSAHGRVTASLSAGDKIGVTFYGDKSGNTADWTVEAGAATHLNVRRLA